MLVTLGQWLRACDGEGHVSLLKNIKEGAMGQFRAIFVSNVVMICPIRIIRPRHASCAVHISLQR